MCRLDDDEQGSTTDLDPSYVVKIEDCFYNEQRKLETVDTDPLFSYFFTGTFLAQLPEENSKPMLRTGE